MARLSAVEGCGAAERFDAVIHALIEWMGRSFSPEQYVFWTRLQCTAWTLADIAIVYYMLRIGDLARRLLNIEPHRISYAILAATLPFAAAIPFQTNGTMIYLLEIAVTVPHFMLILITMACDAGLGLRALKKIVEAPERVGVDGSDGSAAEFRGHT